MNVSLNEGVDIHQIFNKFNWAELRKGGYI